jgi:hypothetical protein
VTDGADGKVWKNEKYKTRTKGERPTAPQKSKARVTRIKSDLGRQERASVCPLEKVRAGDKKSEGGRQRKSDPGRQESARIDTRERFSTGVTVFHGE